jgi:hypothetical protein
MTLKTKPTSESVHDFIEAIPDENIRADCHTLCSMMEDVTGEPPVLWGPSIVGFDKFHYVYDSGREGDWLLTGFSPRKKNLSLYLMDGCSEHQQLLDKLGKHKSSVSCLYINKLADVDLMILRQIIKKSVDKLKLKYS